MSLRTVETILAALLVAVFAYCVWLGWSSRPERPFRGERVEYYALSEPDAEPWPVATEADKRAADRCTKRYGGGPVNPLYVQKYGHCPQEKPE